MNYKIVLDRTFEKEVKQLAKRYPSLKSDIKALRDEILANPTAGTDLGGAFARHGRQASPSCIGKKALVFPFRAMVQANSRAHGGKDTLQA